jgi:hypothetical protein
MEDLAERRKESTRNASDSSVGALISLCMPNLC